jgi:hypothetical protein
MQAQSDNAQKLQVNYIGEIETRQPKSRLSDVELLHWMAECPLALDGLAKTHRKKESLRLALHLWQEAGCPDLEEWHEKLAAVAQPQRPVNHA